MMIPTQESRVFIFSLYALLSIRDVLDELFALQYSLNDRAIGTCHT